MSGKTFTSVSDENASVPTKQFSWQSDAESRGHYDWQDFSIWVEETIKLRQYDFSIWAEEAVKRRQYDFAISVEGCRNAVYRNASTAYWLRNTLLAVEHSQPCMQSPAKQTVAYFLLGELPTQL